MKHGLVLGLLSGALLVGCMSAGVEVRPEQMAIFRRGVTTLQEVTATLGPAASCPFSCRFVAAHSAA